jgi:hypothetical protein
MAGTIQVLLCPGLGEALHRRMTWLKSRSKVNEKPGWRKQRFSV